MDKILSNSWIVNILSGIIVFILTNAIVMLQSKRKYKKQISDANSKVINRLREYVVDNGLPESEIINAVKASTSREYNIKFDELLSVKELCEELVTDIISNIYISNENKIKYIQLLQNYLSKEGNFDEDSYIAENSNVNNKDNFWFIEMLFSFSVTLSFFLISTLFTRYKYDDVSFRLDLNGILSIFNNTLSAFFPLIIIIILLFIVRWIINKKH